MDVSGLVLHWNIILPNVQTYPIKLFCIIIHYYHLAGARPYPHIPYTYAASSLRYILVECAVYHYNVKPVSKQKEGRQQNQMQFF